MNRRRDKSEPAIERYGGRIKGAYDQRASSDQRDRSDRTQQGLARSGRAKGPTDLSTGAKQRLLS